MLFEITREIGIDVGHRVPDHGSKCRNLHGHRYTIHATCSGPLFQEGEQKGMVLDFGFLKEEMMDAIDKPCDHGTILYLHDPLLARLAGEPNIVAIVNQMNQGRVPPFGEQPGWAQPYIGAENTKLYIVNFVPTAENLAAHWWFLLLPKVTKRSKDMAKLKSIKVWETPNCFAVYPS